MANFITLHGPKGKGVRINIDKILFYEVFETSPTTQGTRISFEVDKFYNVFDSIESVDAKINTALGLGNPSNDTEEL